MRQFIEKCKALLAASVAAAAILAIGQGLWGALAFANVRFTPSVPWAGPAMAFVLWVLWRVLKRRPDLLRAHPVSVQVFVQALFAGALGVAALTGYWIVMFSLVKMPPNLLPAMHGVPPFTLLVLAVAGSLAAPFSEEAAFRGYAQALLERKFTATGAIAIASLLFALAHAPHGLLPPKLFVYFLAGLLFAAIARKTKSILPAIAVHAMADITFFVLIWPYDAARHTIWEHGAGADFWVHLAQALTCTVLCIAVLKIPAGSRPVYAAGALT